jgi:rubrerythrin
VTQNQKKTLSAKAVVADFRARMTDEALLQKYGLSKQSLQKLFAKLIKSNFITQNELELRNKDLYDLEKVPQGTLPVDPAQTPKQSTPSLPKFKFTCPACNALHYEKLEVCTQCGVIVSKFLEKQRRLLAEEESRRKAEEESRRKAEEESRRKAEEESRRKAEEESAELKIASDNQEKKKIKASKKCKECGTEISSKAEACPNCGAVLKKKTGCLTYVVAAILIIVLIGLIGLLGREGRPRSSKPESGLRIPTIGKEVVTFDEYTQIRTGMSYRSVISIIGAEGEEISRNRLDGVPGAMGPIETIMYQWVNDSGSNMNAMFQNDRLIQKAQFGLR